MKSIGQTKSTKSKVQVKTIRNQGGDGSTFKFYLVKSVKV